jgi:hypothetical protein
MNQKYVWLIRYRNDRLFFVATYGFNHDRTPHPFAATFFRTQLDAVRAKAFYDLQWEFDVVKYDWRTTEIKES